ncbi:MAG: 4Fe-4S binding protein [Clostridiales bacterium]|nr:4Fe-4S binding protein [Clostridiales bacterium]
MKRNIIKIDESKCNGCGICIDACHEGALQLIDGKAKLISESYCDGLGNCLPECPTGAITIEERECAAFDEEAVKIRMAEKNTSAVISHGCPGSRAMVMNKKDEPQAESVSTPLIESQLRQWPCQIKLVPPNAPYFKNAHLLIAADCTAFAYGNIHNDFIKNKVTLIGCPKLDSGDYSEKLTDILANNDIKSVTVLRMEVPCCGGIVSAVTTALRNSEKMIPWNVVTISVDGRILDN